MTDQPAASYRDLILWQRAVQLCVAVYKCTARFPRDEIYGLTTQLRRSSLSIPGSIAEGYGRLSREQYKHFLGVAQGFNFQLQTQLVVARELAIGEPAEIEQIEGFSVEVGKMVSTMLKRL